MDEAKVLRTVVILHYVMPGYCVASAEARPRETIGGFLRRNGWAKHTKKYGWEFRLPTICVVNGEPLLRAEWRRRIRAGDKIEFWSRPTGGSGGTVKQVIGIVALVAVAALAFWVGGALATMIGGTWGTVIGGVVTAAIGIGGALLINALVAPKAGGSSAPGSTSDQVLNTIQAQGNQARPFQPIPVSYGRIKTYPDFAATPWSEYSGNDQLLHILLSVGLGTYSYESILIDDNILWNSSTGIQSGYTASVSFYDPGQTVTAFATNQVTSSSVSGQQLSQTPVGPFVCTAPGVTANYISIDVVFPAGLWATTQSNPNPDLYYAASVTINADYQQIDDSGAPLGGWNSLFSTPISAATRNPYRQTLSQTVAAGRYQVRLSRANAESQSVLQTDKVVWVGMRSNVPGVASFPTSTVAISIWADAINANSARKFSVIRTRKIGVWTGAAFVVQASRNPIWAFYDALTDQVYGAGYDQSKIDFNNLVSLATAADSRGDTFDYEFNTAVIVPEALDTILRSTRCRHFWAGDVVSAVRDEARTVPDMLITDREIVRGTLMIDYILNDDTSSDSVIIEYVDQNTWLPADVQYPPNTILFTAQNPTQIKIDGIVQRQQALNECSFYYLQSIYRRQTVHLDTEWDGRRLTYGMHVRVQSELPQSWGWSGAIISISGATLVVTPAPSWADVVAHYIRIRTATGRVFGPVLCTQGVDSAHVVLDGTDLSNVQTAQGMTLAQATARTDGGEPASFEFGTSTKTSRDCIVLSGRPNGENRLTLEMAVDNPAIYGSPGSPPILPTGNLPPGVKVPVIAGLYGNFTQGVAEPVLQASWFPAAGAQYYRARVSYDGGVSWTQIYQGSNNTFSVVVELVSLTLQVSGVGDVQGPWTQIAIGAPTITILQDSVALQSLQAGIRDYVSTQFKKTTDAIAGIEQLIASVAADNDAHSWLNKKDVRTDLVSAVGSATAEITTLQQTQVSDEAAFASYQTTVSAQFAGQDASITTNATAIATVNGKLAATYAITADVNGYVSGLKLYDTGATSFITLRVDNFQIAWPGVGGGAAVPVYQIANVNGTAKLSFRGDMVADGTITATKILAGTITSTQIAASTITSSNIAANTITATNIVSDSATATWTTIAGDQQIAHNVTATIASVAITVARGNVIITGSIDVGTFIADTVNHTGNSCILRIKDGTTVLDSKTIYATTVNVDTNSGVYWPDGHIFYLASLSIGAHTLNLEIFVGNGIFATGNYDGVLCKAPTIVAWESRR